MTIALVLLAPSPRADAASFKDLWMRPDQQAAAALAEGDAKTAAGVARSPDWHGSASFRAGDFESAATDYAEVENADGAYNQGNALAKLGKYDEAIAAYDRALKLSPDMDDAKANKAAVEEWMKRQQKQDKSSQKQQSKQNGSKDKQQGGDKSEQPSDEQQDQDKQDQSGEQNQDQQAEQQDGSKSDQGDGEKEQQSDSQQKSGGEEQKQQSSEGTEGSTSEAQSQVEPSEGKPSSAQQQALSKAIDQQLAQGGKPDKDGKPAAAVEEDDATQEKRQALDHLLQRVPDDPGGLLRRKFLLEHQRRMQHGDDNG